MTSREELANRVRDEQLSEWAAQKRLLDEQPGNYQSEPEKRPGRIRVFLTLLALQIVLLLTWAALFFLMGMLTRYEMIPFLPKLIEAIQVLLS